MLFAVMYRNQAGGEERDQRAIQLFASWSPPEGVEIKAHYAFATGGGIAICEANSSAALFEGLAPWIAFNDYQIEPIIDISEAVPIWQRVFAWRDSID